MVEHAPMAIVQKGIPLDAASGTESTVPPGRLAAAWAGLPTRARLILVVLAIDVIAAILSCGVIVATARRAVQVEMKATRATVEPLVSDTISLARDLRPDALLHALDLRFQILRHVRVSVVDAQGRPAGHVLQHRRRETHEAPAWFVALIKPVPEQHELPIDVGNVRIGTALITNEPLDEIDEVWSYAKSLALASLLLNLAVLIALYVAFGRVLKPLEGVAEGLTQLERHDYTARLAPPNSRELAVISERFNSLAGALGEARAANGRLTRQLLTAQDDERRRIALELHDEFGPCLFALEANAASVARIAEGPSEPDRGKLVARAGEISGIVAQVQARNRELLNALRPHGLGQVPLAECLALLIRDFSRRHPATRFEGEFGTLARGYGDIVDLTVFRCVQESMTNAVRHGDARNLWAEAREAASGSGAPTLRALHITVRDDGGGFSADHGVGLGLSGMRERVEALDGRFELDKSKPGAVVRIVIPIEPETADPETAPDDALPAPASLPSSVTA